ncbi:uncharacterized protein LACBIDRAFT_323940 [Laccaria bicolor S238N-H82]|uniref:Predicted protein n=1 Tax=Laccaria bicolor (strain S238N-H82 / ATCC MYA-4686) TaxID=486041 RepID=B0D041_LACBS|nr:uncharacterized protein LACBIDRAFT_323940 [Laccaria bicolor S238N-H82]EDR11761.1 predicted protein [Laccaria bicolor S238N-H82]|eukprot:XP_001877658.1 predicted protein [Laccaria bicolor S238N-H82]
MRALLGVTHTRVNGKMALELPAPLEPGLPVQMSAEGHKLWNPYWLKETTDAEDAENAKFIDTVVSTLVANSKAPGAVSLIPAASLEPPYEAIFNAVKGHFTYLCGKYQQTVDPAAKGKGKKKVEDSRHRGQKKTKLARRMGHVSEFEKEHAISGISDFVAFDYMSSKDDGPGLVSKETWAQKAGRYGGCRKTMLEVPRLQWRDEKVSRLYYALDKIAWDAGETSTHGRFHGFQENTDVDKPKCRVPRSMLDEGWIVASGNQNIIVAPEPKGVKLKDIKIEDSELDQEDLAALKEWREWDSEPSQINIDDTNVGEV